MSISKNLLDKLSFGQADEVMQLSDVEKGKAFYQADSYQLGYPNLYGGQVLAQALGAIITAASRKLIFATGFDAIKTEGTAPKSWWINSLHGTFLRPGSWDIPIGYRVDSLAESASFNRYQVSAEQQGKDIFSAFVSVKRFEATRYQHFDKPQSVASWEGLKNDDEIREQYQQGPFSHAFPIFATKAASNPRPIEIRPVDPIDWMEPKVKPAQRYFWFRFKGASALQHISLSEKQQLITYASDYGIIAVALLPHGVTWYQGAIYMASLDHSIWFYQDFNIQDWFLFDCVSPVATDGRALVQGKIYDQSGRLIAQISQEALLRSRR